MMFALNDISRFDDRKEAYKILKPYWDVISNYLVIFLGMMSVLFAGVQVTSGTFECLPAVNCSGSNTSSSLHSHAKYSNVCEVFYSSRKTNVLHRTDVVSDIKSTFQYTAFVNSECSKSAIPFFLAYFPIVLFIEALLLYVVENLWLKIPCTASVIEHFVALVTKCYTSPCPNFALPQAVLEKQTRHHEQEQQLGDNIEMRGRDTDVNQFHDLDFSVDPVTINLIVTLYEKAHILREKLKSSRKILLVYFSQAIFQAVTAFSFLIIDIVHRKDLQGEVYCEITQQIPVPHDYFVCSHNLAPAFWLGLMLYLPTLGSAIVFFIIKLYWIISLLCDRRKSTFKYDFTEQVPWVKEIERLEVPKVEKDLGFLLHLLNSYDKLYVVRFAYFLSEKNERKFQAYLLKKQFPTATLERQLKRKNNKITLRAIPGIPGTIFDVASDVKELELEDCRLKDDDFDELHQLSKLTTLSVVNCSLESIPEGILKLPWLKRLSLKGNSLTSINQGISELQSLVSLDLSDNDVQAIPSESIEKNPNLLEVNLSGNRNLNMYAIKIVLACKKLETFHSPAHIDLDSDELNNWEKIKFGRVNASERDYLVTTFAPEAAPFINLNEIYKMDSSPKGIAFIICNERFRDTSYPDRPGSARDISLFKSLLKQIGFKMTVYENIPAREVKEILTREAYLEYDCFAVIIMSYVDEKGVIFTDGESVSVKDLIGHMQKFPSYQGKPKIFFVQATNPPYRFIHGVQKTTIGDSTSLADVLVETPIAEDNILLSLSTMDRPASSSNEKSGSWYIRTLFHTFRLHAWKEDIESLLTLVKQEVVRSCDEAQWKQVPPPQSTLKKKLYLLPGYSVTPHPTETAQQNA